MKEYKSYKENIELKIEIYYNKGGMNYFSNRVEKRGYYISICPVMRTYVGNIVTEQYTAFSGIKMIIKETERKSEKAYNEAVNIGISKIDELINNLTN